MKDLNIWTLWCELVSVKDTFISLVFSSWTIISLLSFSIVWHGINVGYFLKQKFVICKLILGFLPVLAGLYLLVFTFNKDFIFNIMAQEFYLRLMLFIDCHNL